MFLESRPRGATAPTWVNKLIPDIKLYAQLLNRNGNTRTIVYGISIF